MQTKTLTEDTGFVQTSAHTQHTADTSLSLLAFLQNKFEGFKQFSQGLSSDSFRYEQLEESDFVFMRWKVLLLLVVVVVSVCVCGGGGGGLHSCVQAIVVFACWHGTMQPPLVLSVLSTHNMPDHSLLASLDHLVGTVPCSRPHCD